MTDGARTRKICTAPSWPTAVLAAFLLSCSGNMGSPGADGGGGGGGGDGSEGRDGSSTSGCIDLDGDGYGLNCDRGPDCDDFDPDKNVDNCTVRRVGGGGDDGGGDGGTSSSTSPWNPTDDNSSGVRVDDDGNLTLAAHPEVEPAVWIANAGEGTVSRLDVRTGRELGRYRSALTRARVENDPSRTAIDFRGDCWVANRAREGHRRGSVTKIASHVEDCIDRNGDGEIQTSEDLNDDGVIDLDSEEYLDADDECILFTVDTGGENAIPRALAIAPDAEGLSSGGNAWVGLNGTRRVLELDGNTGEVRRRVDVPLNPYGALASKYEGRVWFTNAGWQSNLDDNPPSIVAIDFRTGEVTPRYEVESTIDCEGTYGITIDAEGHVWVAGYPCESAFRFDPNTEEWMTVHLPGTGRPRGLVADSDGYIWMAHSNNCGRSDCGLVTRFWGEDGSDVEQFWLPNGNDTIGVDLDADGRVWVVSQGTDNAARIDPATGTIDEFPTGDSPYTYSDFTGHSLLLQFPRGYYRDVIEACSFANWLNALWDAWLPADTSVEIRVRTAQERIDLGSAEWYGPFRSSPSDLQAAPGPVPPGRFLEFEITLITTNDLELPSVGYLEISYECPLT